MTILSERFQQVLDLIHADPTLTLQKIGDQIGVTRERVRQIAVKLQEKGLLTDRHELKLEAIASGRRLWKVTRENRKKIWRKMMFVAHRTRMRDRAHIDHNGLTYDYHMPGHETICMFEGCTNPVRARGFCLRHYGDLRWTGALWVRRRFRSICIEADCGLPVYARNRCRVHYNAWRRKNPVNSITPNHNTSGYRGVGPGKGSAGWIAYIRENDKQRHLGTFDTKEMAARAYDTAARRVYGEKAKLNFPDETIEVYAPIRRLTQQKQSGHKGIVWHGIKQRWIVKLDRYGQKVYVGTFVDLETAIQAQHGDAPAPRVKSSQYRGVSRAKKKWKAMLQTGGKSYQLGLYDDETAAARAYDKAARQMLSENAILNFPDDTT